uniref:hypothetical protein n=1 Tax=Candidatus Limisoma sp. TaxID=3076476 RepID=UPI004025A526
MIYLESKAEGIYPVGFLKGLSRHGLQCRDSRQLRIIPAITAAAGRRRYDGADLFLSRIRCEELLFA